MGFFDWFHSKKKEKKKPSYSQGTFTPARVIREDKYEPVFIPFDTSLSTPAPTKSEDFSGHGGSFGGAGASGGWDRSPSHHDSHSSDHSPSYSSSYDSGSSSSYDSGGSSDSGGGGDGGGGGD